MKKYLESFVTDFTTHKRVVIPSRSIRIPELCCKVFLILAVVVYFLCYQLHFYGEKSGLAFSVRPTYMHSESNWWTCSMYNGSCRYDIPKKSKLPYCQGNQTRPKWNVEKREMEEESTKIECNSFNFDKDVVELPSQLWVTTSKLQVMEKALAEGGDYQMDNSSDEGGVSYTMGPEQIVLFDAALPHELGLTSLMELQGFLNYDGGRDVRRIPFARKGDWVDDGVGVLHWEHWVSQYPAKSDGNSKKPGVGANDTGCFQVAEAGEGVFCHLSELLKAAGVDMDKNANSKPSRRLKGITLNVEFQLTNWDVRDFWTWPFGKKRKYVVNVKASGRSHAALYRRYEQVDNTTRRRVDHYGINVNVNPKMSWAEFNLPNLCQTIVVVGAVLRYFDKFVIGLLVQLYAWMGHDHLSRLYEFNTLARSASEKDIEQAYKEAIDDHHIRFKNLHDKAEVDHLCRIHGKDEASSKMPWHLPGAAQTDADQESTYTPLSTSAS